MSYERTIRYELLKNETMKQSFFYNFAKEYEFFDQILFLSTER